MVPNQLQEFLEKLLHEAWTSNRLANYSLANLPHHSFCNLGLFPLFDVGEYPVQSDKELRPVEAASIPLLDSADEREEAVGAILVVFELVVEEIEFLLGEWWEREGVEELLAVGAEGLFDFCPADVLAQSLALDK